MIEVGEYIRTSNGIIAKLERIKSELRYKYWANNGECYTEKAIKKHSFNIIDLIKEGDYINGHRIVNEIYGEDDNELYFEIEGGFNKADYISEKDIKSIVTKEQFKNTEYVI